MSASCTTEVERGQLHDWRSDRMQTSARKLTQAVQPNGKANGEHGKTRARRKLYRDASCTAERRESCTAKHAQGGSDATDGQPNTTARRTVGLRAVGYNRWDAYVGHERSVATDGQPNAAQLRTSDTTGRTQPTDSRTLQPMGHVRQLCGRTESTGSRTLHSYGRSDTTDGTRTSDRT